MSVNFEIPAVVRNDLGKGASRRLRREAKVLGIVYGGDEAATPIMLEQNVVKKALEDEGVFSHILSLNLNGKKQQVVLKDLQRHPYKPIIQHIDFQRVKATDYLTMHIPVHFHGESKCVGVENGGIINHNMIEVEVRCQANRIPEHLDVDVANLDVDQSIHLSQLKVPAGVELVLLAHGHDEIVVSVHKPRQTKLDEEQAAEEAAAAAIAATAAAEAAASAEQAKSEVKDAAGNKASEEKSEKDKK